MLCDLVNGRERSSVVCIEDTVELSGLKLLCCFVKSLLKRLDEVHVLCFEPPSQLLTQCDRLHLHDGFSDTYGWLETQSCLTVNSDIEKYLSDNSEASANQRSAVVIDTLTPLITQYSAVKSCQILQSLCKARLKGGNVSQVVFLLHGDLHDDHSLSLIHHVTTSILKIFPSKSPNHGAICNVLHKKSSGKVIKLSEHFDVNSSLDIQNVEEWRPSIALTTDISASQPDPTANLTFNLSLTDEEKQARSKLVLPYTKAMDRPSVGTDDASGGGGGGKIFYQPDEADDFDEEDPDDDLDI